MVTPQATRRTLYVSDLDRTLLRSGGTIGDASIHLLNEAIDQGALFTYATARSPDSARKATEDLHLNLPVITYGGTVTADPTTGTPSEIRFLTADIVSDTLRVAERYPRIAPLVYTFENGRDWIRWHPARLTSGIRTFISQHIGDRRLRPITKADPIDLQAIHYVSILAEHDDLAAFRAAIRDVLAHTAHFLSVYDVTPGLDWLEFHHPAGTKAQAIHRLMADINMDRLVVFGDNHNDLPMFEIADESYAVQNAVPELASIASAVIGHHECDAVARFIAEDFGLASARARPN